MRMKDILEHKKGVRAKIYTKKGPEPRHVPKRPQQGPVATAFDEAATLSDYQAGRTATITDPEHGKSYTLDLTKPENMAALHPNDQGQIEFNPDFDPAGGGLGGQAQGQEQQPLQPGAPIQIKTATEEDIGGDATDDFINDVTDHEFERNAKEEVGAEDTPQQIFDQGLASLSPEDQQQAASMIVKDAEGDIDFSETLVKMTQVFSDGLPELAKMFEQIAAQCEAYLSTPEFAQENPQDQAKFKQDLAEMKQSLVSLKAQIPGMQAQIQAGQDQLRSLPPGQAKQQMGAIRAPQGAMERPGTMTQAVQEQLNAMLRIAGLR